MKTTLTMRAAATKTWLGVCLAVLTLAGNAQEPKGAERSALPTTSWPTNGGDLGNRASCHGTDGSGGHGGPAFTAGLSLAQVRKVVVQGRNEMPAFGAMMTPEHLRDVTAHAQRLLVP